MDASASPTPGADNVFDFFMKLDNTYSAPIQQRTTVVKYTKLPDFDFDAKVSWPNTQSYLLKPRLRRIIRLDDDDLKTHRSLKASFGAPAKEMSASYTKRKFVTITEDDDNSQRPGYYTTRRRNSPVKMSNRCTEVDFKSDKTPSSRCNSKMSSATKYTNETKTSAKPNNLYCKREVNVYQQNHYRGKRANSPPKSNPKMKQVHEKVSHRYTNPTQPARPTISQNCIISSESGNEIDKIKNIFLGNHRTDLTRKHKPAKSPMARSPLIHNKNKMNFKDFKKPVTLIRVPIDNSHEMSQDTDLSTHSNSYNDMEIRKVNRAHNANIRCETRDVNMNTDPPEAVDQVTEIDDANIKDYCKCESSVQTETYKEVFDSLEIPNVTLTKDKSENKETDELNNTSSPNLNIPPINVTPVKEDVTSNDLSICKGASYIISRATLTYTTSQEFNFHIVENDEHVSPNITCTSPLEYPINVMSVFKNELLKKQDNILNEETNDKKNHSRHEHMNCLNELASPNYSYVCNKLMKPSDIISTIRVNNDLLQNDFICEQFQRELNFIDSFFESLQYLENCSLTNKCISDSKVDSLVNNSVLFDSTFAVKNSEYDNFLSKLENGANIDDTETMASQSLCLLNLLIRDEQRRAKNLLIVLKMREDALKDFTKSQILWLEKKKKLENTDISTLKKKQRGALLKLQHECGEMQRMRKALLTLSEKRKVALMKTKKNIELKLKNNVDVEQIILGKKKLRRISGGDRNASPLKCFDLSSSGCEESTTSRQNSDAVFVPTSMPKVTSVEKYVQTAEAEASTADSKEIICETTAENFIAVDGGYLNILFHDLALPQIFSSGKQYEVNEEELKNIVSTSSHHFNTMNSSEVVDKLMDHIKNSESEKSDSSTPSTARSLVEEFDQYYKGLFEEENLASSSPKQKIEEQRGYSSVQKVYEVRDTSAQLETNIDPPVSKETITCDDKGTLVASSLLDSANTSSVFTAEAEVETDCGECIESVSSSQTTGPLPVPVGAAAVVDSTPPDATEWTSPNSTSTSTCDSGSKGSEPQNDSSSSLINPSTPVQCEAEELRRQQLAIEREIKALEQQQCRLLVVREIPDKPPPPYTPPTETKPKPPRMFAVDDAAETKIKELYNNPKNDKSTDQDAFDSFLADYCAESIQRHKQEQSDQPWHACNLLPQKPPVDTDKQIQNTFMEIKEVLTSVTPPVVSGVSNRRSDHIDDILFTEWRRCEPDWTTLNNDEVFVKNQIFESIFQKILSETIDEYKKTVNTE